MKKLMLITLMMCLVNLISFSQEKDTTINNVEQQIVNSEDENTVIINNESEFIYCELVGTGKFLSTKVTVEIDYGQETKLFQDVRIRNEQTGKVQSFNSMIDALNYMGKNGWEFVQAYVVTTQNQNVYRWLLKKRK